LGRAADLADHDDALGLRVVLEQLQAVNEVEALDRVAADADHRGLAEALLGGLVHGFIRQRAGARNDGDLARLVDVARHDADLALARGDDAGAVGADQPAVVIVRQRVLHAQHVQHRDALGDGDDHPDAGVGRFQDGVGRERRRHVDDGGVRAGLVHRVLHGVEHRQADVLLATLARRHAADDPGAVLDHLFGVEGALRPGEALDDDLGGFVDQHAHVFRSLLSGRPRRPGKSWGGPWPADATRQWRATARPMPQAAASTAFRAPSLRSSAGVILRPLSRSSCLPFSTLVPSRRTTTGTLTSTSFTAAMMPSAIMSQRTMPPKMLTRMAFTLSEDRISLKASVTRSLVAPPPTSRKLAGSPPASLITSMVAMARPAPLTMQPMLPSMVT